MDRLTSDDLVVLWPDAQWPQDIGALAILDGRHLLTSDGSLRTDEIRAAIATRLGRVPRMRQVLWHPARWLGRPLWVDAPTFNLARHVRVAPLPPGADEAELVAAAEHLLGTRMDRSQPLWEMWLLPGLTDRRVGLFLRMHHAMADGLAGLSILTDLLDTSSTIVDPPERWRPRPAPTTGDLLLDNVGRLACGLGRGLRRLARPDRLARGMVALGSEVRGLTTAPPTPLTSLDRVVGTGRALAVLRWDLADVTAAAHGRDATVNDVLLAAVAGGLDALFVHRGDRPDAAALPVYVPVSLRPVGGRRHARGNRIAQMVVQVPLGVRDPADRLARIARATRTAKAENHPALGLLLGSRLARQMLLKFLRTHPVNVTTADLPGPTRTLRLAGAPVVEVFPILPLIGHVTLGVAALSYAGQLTMTVVADRDSHPDLPVFWIAVGRELAALRDASTVG